MDISIEAIESDLLIAEAQGVPLRELALVRARIRATLLAAGIRQEAATPSASELQARAVFELRRYYAEHPEEREREMAFWSNIPPISDEEAVEIGRQAERIIDGPSDVDPGEVEIDDEDDEDFFAEARKGKK